MAGERFRLEQDDDCHWYLVPVEQSDAFEAWAYDEDYPDPWPEGVVSIGGAPSLVTFSDPVID